ncbi:MAG: FeoA family protein [Desulfovibrionaceae bacterium]
MHRMLRDLRVGEKAIVCSVLAEGEIGRRLMDMGIIPGTEIEIVGRAPLQDPVAVRLKGFTLSLRNNEAGYIQVSTE